MRIRDRIITLAVLAAFCGGFPGGAAYLMTEVHYETPSVRYPPVPAPADLCTRLRTDLVARLVPAPGPPEAKTSRNGDDSTVYCFYRTDTGRAETTAAGTLSIELIRHGGEVPATIRRTLRDGFEEAARTPPDKGHTERRVPGLGDAATVTVDTSIGRWYVNASAYVLLGTQTLRVNYTASPGDATRTGDAAVAMAREALART